MEYKINALSIYEYGQRKDKEGKPHQEDWIYPSLGNINNEKDRLFILCDGMGGHSAGEVASAAVCEAMSKTINEEIDKGKKFSEALLLKAIDAAYNLLDERDTSDDAQKKMGTTMTLLMFHESGVTMAHIGDSRIYHIRPTDEEYAQIVRQTVDHSLVNDLLRIGELTPEEAETYPHKNIITRAMQPNLEHRHKADIVTFKNIRPGDYFYMCSDGMLEQTSDKNLCWIFNNNVSDEQKQKMLVDNSSHNRDNHSAHIIHILDVQPESEIEDNPISVPEESEVDDGYELVNPEFDEQDKFENVANDNENGMSPVERNNNDERTQASFPLDKEITTLEGSAEDTSATFCGKQGLNNYDKGHHKLMWIILTCIAIAILAICVVLFSKSSEKKEVTPLHKEEVQVTLPDNNPEQSESAASATQVVTNPDKAAQANQDTTQDSINGTSSPPSTDGNMSQPQESTTQTTSSEMGLTQNGQQIQNAHSASGGTFRLQNVQNAFKNSQTSGVEGATQSAESKVQNSNKTK